MWNIATLLCVIWLVTLLYGEMFAFWEPSLWSCSWPKLQQVRSSKYLHQSLMALTEVHIVSYKWIYRCFKFEE